MRNRILEFLGREPITKLSAVSGVHRNTLRAYINGTDPKLSNADAVAKALGKTIYEVWPDLKSTEHE